MTATSIALVGCGRWGRHVLRDLTSLGCTVAVVDADATARDYALAQAARSATTSLAHVGEIDGVVIATPAATHADVIDEALVRGIPIFCEKPLALSVAQATEVAARAGGRLFVMDKWRYQPGVEAIRDLARANDAGCVLELRTTRIGRSPPQRDSDPVWTLAPHDLSIALEILASIPPPKTAVAELREGRAVGLTAILGDRPRFTMEVSGASAVTRREIRLTTEHMVAVLPDAYSDHILVARDVGAGRAAAPERRPISVEPPLLRELRAFVAYLGGGPKPRSSAAEGVLIVQTLVRLRQMAGIDEDGGDRTSGD